MVSKPGDIPVTKTKVLSWELVIVKILLFALLAVMLEKPAGSIAGRIALEQDGFNLYTYNLKENRVYVLATCQEKGSDLSRGVWVNKDGSFRIDNLPIGEYTLRARVPGFNSNTESGIFVKEGQVAKLPQDISLQISNPSMNLASNCRVFSSVEKPHFWINAQSATSVKVRVFKKDMLPFLKRAKTDDLPFEFTPTLSAYRPYDEKRKTLNVFAGLEPIKEWARDLKPDAEDWAHEEFKFDESLPPGEYLVEATATNLRGASDKRIMWLSVSDLGLVVKQDSERALVRAINLRTLQPVEGAEVSLYDRSNLGKGEPIAKGQSGKDGFLNLKLPAAYSNNCTLLAYGLWGENHAFGGVSYYSSTNDSYKTYFYTDRPIYRLGQTVKYKTLLRTLGSNGLKNPGAGVDVDIKLENPDNEEIWSGKAKTNDYGTFNGAFEIPADAHTGAYQVSFTYPDGTSDFERFEVEQYRKPEYKVEVIPLNERVSAGSKVKARVRATYYFGAPVTNARIKYSVFYANDWLTRLKLEPRPAYYDYFDDWETEGYYDSSAGDFLEEGYAQTDASGEAIIEFDSRKIDQEANSVFNSAYDDERYKVEVEVTDISRLTVTSSAKVLVTPGDYTVFVQPDNYVVKVGEKVGAEIVALDYNGQPMGNTTVLVQLQRRPWDRIAHNYRDTETLEQQKVVTDNEGKAKVLFNTEARFYTDTYYLVATAQDAERHKIMTYNSLWVASDNYPYRVDSGDAQKEPLSILPDKAAYQPGETARIMITAPVSGKEGAEALVTVEGLKLYNYRVVKLDATAKLVEIPIDKTYAPNVFVNVTYIGPKHQFYNQEKLIKVAPQSNFLTLNVESDKSKYKPGETATYTLTALKADGKPANATELSFGLVDESIYAIRPEYAQDIRKFFYSQRPNNVSTYSSFPEEYSGGPSKIEPRVRKDFKDTAAWFPNLLTDSNGKVRVKVKLPDNLTTWRATVRGIDKESLVGSTIQKVVSTQDLIVRLALPRFFCQGDEGLVTAIVHNYSDIAQDVKVDLSLSSNFKTSTVLSKKEKILPEKAARISWPVYIETAGEGTVGVKAVGQTEGDAMELKLPVRPLGVPVLITRSGVLDGDGTAAVPMEYPTDAASGSVNASISLSSSTLGPVLGNFSSLIDYPYGCTEQTMSRLLPATIAMKLHKKLGVTMSPEDKKKFQTVYEKGIAKLYLYQHGDGGWGWWENDSSNIYLSSLVLEGFNLLKESGYAVSPESSKRGIAWLKVQSAVLNKQLSDPMLKNEAWQIVDHSIDLAKSIYVLSLHGEKPGPELKVWLTDKSKLQSLPPEALCFFSLGFKRGGDLESAKIAFNRLKELANAGSVNNPFSNWEHNPDLLAKLQLKDWYSYRFTGVESTALGLSTCLAMDPDDRPRIESIKNWLLLQRGKDGWGNTKTTARVLSALSDDEISVKKAGPVNFMVSTSFGDFSFDPASRMKAEKKLSLKLVPGAEKLLLKKTGSGRLYWTALMRYYKKLSPAEVSGSAVMANEPAALKMDRSFFRLVATPPDSTGRISFKQEPIKDLTVKAGETILMRLKITSPTSVPYSLLEAALPSGAEVVQNDGREDVADSANSSDEIETDFGNWWWNHQDVLDDKVAFFVTSFPSGVHEIHTMMRMELPGKFKLNPVTMEGMYTNSIRGYSSAGELKVVE